MLVTNVGQGYGRAIALAYGRAGYDVVCADRDVDLASKTAAELEELGGQAIPIQADMTTHMDVLAAYEKVMEIFGELGGVVHLATHVSSTAFENLGEGEFFELMSEDVRSTYLVLKAAARLRSVGWVAVVAPPALGSVQMLSVQGALEKMIEGFTQRYAFPRANLVVPSRQASDPRHDQALVRLVRYFGSPESAGVGGQTMRVELPAPPSATDNLLPEVRAALDLTGVQDDTGYDMWALEPLSQGGLPSAGSGALSSAATRARAESTLAGSMRAVLSDDEVRDQVGLNRSDRRPWPSEDAYNGSVPGAYQFESDSEDDADEELDDLAELDEFEEFDERLAAAHQDAQGGFEDDSDDDITVDSEDDVYSTWGEELGLPPGSPALRHLIGADPLHYTAEDNYFAGFESARDLYGDLSRLEGADADEYFDLRAEGAPEAASTRDDKSRRRT